MAWLVVGRTDRRMLKIYNHQLHENWTCLADLAGVANHTSVGSVEVTDKKLTERKCFDFLVEKKRVKDVPLGSALIPLFLLLFWAAATIALILNELL